MNRLAVFDCDGTLVDSQYAILAAMTDAFCRADLSPPTRADALSVIGLSLNDAMQVLVPGASAVVIQRLVKGYKSAFQALRANGGVHEPLYHGIAEVIDVLRARGWLLGVATGKSDRGLRHCLARHGLVDHFVTLQTADRHPSKPHPSMVHAAMAEAGAQPAQTIVIGDTSFDMAMARAAGTKALGVDWGYHPAEDLRGAGAFSIAHVPADILLHLEGI